MERVLWNGSNSARVGSVRSSGESMFWRRTKYVGPNLHRPYSEKSTKKNSEKPLGTWNLSRIFLRLWKVSDLGFFVKLFLLPMSEQLSEPTETTKWENIVKYNAIYINTYDCNRHIEKMPPKSEEERIDYTTTTDDSQTPTRLMGRRIRAKCNSESRILPEVISAALRL